MVRDTDDTAWPPAASVLDWLLDSDPSIRWQVLRDLADADVDSVAAERARVAEEGWGRRLLDSQRPDGQWGDGEAHPFWWTNLYTMLYLRDLGADPENDRTRRAIELVHSRVNWGPWHGYSPFFEGEEEPCINGRVVALGAYFGRPSLRLVDLLLSEQLDDGGWNCETINGSVRSSFHSTICVLEGLLAHEGVFGEDSAITEARERGAEYLLERHLLRRLSTGVVIDEGWRLLAFPPLWHYDVLRGLEYAVKAGFKNDPRLAEAIETVESRRLSDGRWPLDVRHKDTLYEEIAGALGGPNRWITFRALRTLRRACANEGPAASGQRL